MQSISRHLVGGAMSALLCLACVTHVHALTDGSLLAAESEQPVVNGTLPGILIEEGFENDWPPTGWSLVTVSGVGFQQGTTGSAGSTGDPYSGDFFAWHNDDSGPQDSWLVSPTFAASSGSELSFWHRNRFMDWYDYSGVWVSAGSCDPIDGDFVELAELTQDAADWTEVSIGLGAYAGQSICLGFQYTGDFAHEWYLDDVLVADLTAAIVVTPDTVDESVVLGQGPVSVTVRIDNPGAAPLTWNVDNAASTVQSFWDQPVSGTSGIVSDFFIGSNAGAYSANDFVVSQTVDLATIYTPGFDNTNSLPAQPGINWHIYADAGGVPAGHPEDGTNGASALWTYTAAVDATGVDISNNEITLDLAEAGQALSLPPGTYWLSVFPDYNVTGAGGARWNWYQAVQVGAETQLVSPGIFNVPDWTPLSALGVTFTDTAFTLEQSVECGASWITADAAGGTVDVGDFVEFTVELDEVAVGLGEHDGFLCIASDAEGDELVVIPVSLTVSEAPIEGLTASNDGPVLIGDLVNFSASITAGSSVSYDWDFGDGNSGSGPDPSHEYLAPGNYTATVTASNSVASEQATTDVQVLGFHTIGGAVSGLLGSGLVLQNNGGDDLAIAADGSFTFATALADLSDYAVTVLTQPSGPAQVCSVSNGSGTLAGADVTNVQVTCTTSAFTIGGTVSGLEGSGLVLQNNGGDDLAIATDGSFTFATALTDLSDYAVTVATQPSDPIQTCQIAAGTGTLAGADVANVMVQCATEPSTLVLSASDLVFGFLFDGQQATQTVTLSSTGTGELVISGISTPAAPFALSGGSCLALPVTLQPGQSCDLEISFAPDGIAPGAFESSIEILSNADSSPDSISLRGSVSIPIAVPLMGPLGLLLMVLLMGGLAGWRLTTRH